MDRDAVPDYEDDYYAWTQAQADALRRMAAARLNADVDWENVAEEIADLGRSERNAVESHLETIIEHLLKLMVSPAGHPRNGWPRNGWIESVGNARIALEKGLSPTLRRHLGDTLADRYRYGRKKAALGLARDGLGIDDLPAECPWTLDRLLDDGFLPDGPAA